MSAYLLLVLALLGLVAAQSSPYFIELPEVFSSSVNITIQGENTMILIGNYYADQSNLVARLDSTGVHIQNGTATVFAHSTIVDALRSTGYELVLDNGVLECIQQTYQNPFDISQLYFEQFIETTYYNLHLVDYVANKSDASGNVITAWVDRFLQIPVGILSTDGFSSTLAQYYQLETSVPENIFNLDRLPTICQQNNTVRRLSEMASESPLLAQYQKFVDRIFPRKM